jgi:hypothetical protein
MTLCVTGPRHPILSVHASVAELHVSSTELLLNFLPLVRDSATR